VKPILSETEREILLDLAYQTVVATAEGSTLPTIKFDQLPECFQHPTATFVTLSTAGVLRGCIGTTQVQQALALDVIQRAQSAASRDPRFPAVTPAEVPSLDIEISLLTPPQPIIYSSPEELLERLQAGREGVIVMSGTHRATFLPQVWDRVNDSQTFLELLCQKASLHRDAWRTDSIKVETYQVESFHRRSKTSNHPREA
jgi:AmmeMemoRadiSam system protein A